MKQIKGKKGMEAPIQQLVIALIIVGVFIAGVLGFIVSVDSTYNIGFDESKFSTFQRISELTNTSIEMGENIETGTGEISGEGDIIEGQATAGFKSTKVMLNPAGAARNMITDGFVLLSGVAVPTEVMYGLAGIVSVIVTFGTIALIMKVRP